eukprot:TRINITY_DN30952_c0_g1_i1.p2 TRINITY_DN30952_c0_g1~~TRINITY_DN30952_c0_g1_i1.p2  ORF type:complete len:271 (-),score=61.51 TRINITY_DN30952_c0_g1_i1:1004-1816(-)
MDKEQADEMNPSLQILSDKYEDLLDFSGEQSNQQLNFYEYYRDPIKSSKSDTASLQQCNIMYHLRDTTTIISQIVTNIVKKAQKESYNRYLSVQEPSVAANRTLELIDSTINIEVQQFDNKDSVINNINQEDEEPKKALIDPWVRTFITIEPLKQIKDNMSVRDSQDAQSVSNVSRYKKKIQPSTRNKKTNENDDSKNDDEPINKQPEIKTDDVDEYIDKLRYTKILQSTIQQKKDQEIQLLNSEKQMKKLEKQKEIKIKIIPTTLTVKF